MLPAVSWRKPFPIKPDEHSANPAPLAIGYWLMAMRVALTLVRLGSLLLRMASADWNRENRGRVAA